MQPIDDEVEDINLIEATLNLGIFSIKKKWDPNPVEKEAAWELYIELVTRVTIVELPENGILREALTSLFSIFTTTRNILKKYGPKVASKASKGYISFGHISIIVLNEVLRPFLAKWHSELQHYEKSRSQDMSPREHERIWEKNKQLRAELNEVRGKIKEFAVLLEEVIEIDTLMDTEKYVEK